MPYLLVFFKYAALSWQLQAAEPTLDPQLAYAHVVAASTVATPQLTPELLLAVAFVESRFDPTATSRVEGKTRRTGRYPSHVPPAALDRRASLFCGPLQTFAASWRDCMAERDLSVAYATGVAELKQWLADPRVHGDVARALAGHGCGNAGVMNGKCNGYAGHVLLMERRFRLGNPPDAPRPRGRLAST